MLKVAIFNDPVSRERPFSPEPSVTLQVTLLAFHQTPVASRYGISVGDAQDVIETAIGGKNLTFTIAQLILFIYF
jgi:Cu/Ag efflux pump CusA